MRLGIDIGGTKTAALVLDESGGIVAQVAAPSGRGNVQVLDTAVSVADRAAALVGGWGHIGHVGACMPGLVDRETGWARHAVNLGVQAIDLAGGIEAGTGRRPSVDNDVKAAALGAHHAVRPEVADGTTAYLNVGTGLAAAIVHRGEVVRGADGCLETIASGTALHRMWLRPAAELFPAAAAGDERARAVVGTLAHGIALAVQVLVVTGAELVVIGGGVARDPLALEAALAADIDARAAGSPFLRRLDLVSRIRVLDGDVPVAAIGAALLPGSTEPVGVSA